MAYHGTSGISCGDVKKKVITMNRKQKIVLWIGIAIIVLMCLFPPWMRIRDFGKSRVVTRETYRFLLTPPHRFVVDHLRNVGRWGEEELREYSTRNWRNMEERFSVDNVYIDFPRLSIQCVIVALIMVGLLCTFATKEKYKNKAQKVEISK